KIQHDNQNTVRAPLQDDRLRLNETLNNLLSNAIKFTPDGGSVWLESLALDGFLQVAVCDTGIGIPAEEHEAIFEKFYQVGDTARRVREDTGLGLSIIQKLVELHGGKIRLESQRGQGSRFIFTLALKKDGHDQS